MGEGGVEWVGSLPNQNTTILILAKKKWDWLAAFQALLENIRLLDVYLRNGGCCLTAICCNQRQSDVSGRKENPLNQRECGCFNLHIGWCMCVYKERGGRQKGRIFRVLECSRCCCCWWLHCALAERKGHKSHTINKHSVTMPITPSHRNLQLVAKRCCCWQSTYKMWCISMENGSPKKRWSAALFVLFYWPLLTKWRGKSQQFLYTRKGMDKWDRMAAAVYNICCV